MCEHPFGTIRKAFNQSYLLLKGFRKVRGEIGLTMLAYNLEHNGNKAAGESSHQMLSQNRNHPGK
jgi:transposase